MGIQLIGAAFRNWSHLNDRPFRALLYMAFKALDTGSPTTAPARYFGGWVDLAGEGLGLKDPKSVAAEKVCTRVVSILIKEKAIQRLVHGGKNHRAVYQLHVYECPKP